MRSGDRKEILDYEAARIGSCPEQVHEAIPMTWVRPPVNANVSKTPEIRALREFVVAVRPDAPFLLRHPRPRLSPLPARLIDMTVNLTRLPGFSEAVALTTVDMPPNLPGPSGTIAKEATSATLKLAIPANVAPGVYAIIIRGSGPFPFAKDPNVKDKPNVTVTEPSNPIILTVRRP